MPRNVTFILLPILIGIAAFLYWQHHQRIYQDLGRLEVSQEGDAVILSWHTDIDVPMATRFREAFNEWGSKTGKFVIDLNSPGGALIEGNKVIEQINAMKPSHVIETHVGPNNVCLSMCVPIFLQGENRIASGSSRWMFHEPTAYDYFSDEEVSAPKFERDYYNNRFFERYFTDSAMDPAWRENLRKEWVGKDVWRTGKQLVDERSNIIIDLY
ncbi:MAG: ATP-dependent Clp protease proteolytic subunit [Pseudomonadota bacterium]